MACAVIFNYYCYNEFCVFGWCARLFLIATIITILFGWRARLFSIIIIMASFVFFGWRARSFLKYYYYHELCFPGGVLDYIKLLIRSQVVFLFGRRARLFLITTTIASFCFFGWCARLSITVASFVVFRVACTVIFNH